MKTKKLKKNGLVFVLLGLMMLMAIPHVSAYGSERHVIIQLYETFVGNDGKIGSGNEDWRWATIYSENGGDWYVYQREAAGAHHADWTSPVGYRNFVMFDENMDHNDRISMIFEDYDGVEYYLHEVRITIDSRSACTTDYLYKFEDNDSDFDPGCGFTASTITDGPGSSNYQRIRISVLAA